MFLNEVFFYPSLEFSKHRWVNIFLYFLGAEGTGEIFFKYGDFYSRDIYARGMGIFSNLGISILGIGDFFKVWGFLSPGLGILSNPGIFIPVIGDFLKSWDFFKSGDFWPRGLGIFENLEIFIPGIFTWSGYLRNWEFLGIGIFRRWRFFFVGWDIPPKSHLWECSYDWYSSWNCHSSDKRVNL